MIMFCNITTAMTAMTAMIAAPFTRIVIFFSVLYCFSFLCSLESMQVIYKEKKARMKNQS